MGWLTAITGFFKTIGILNDRISQLISYFQKAEQAGWFKQVNADFKPLIDGPTTGEQKSAAAKAIATDISHI